MNKNIEKKDFLANFIAIFTFFCISGSLFAQNEMFFATVIAIGSLIWFVYIYNKWQEFKENER